MGFDQAAVNALFDSVQSHAMTLGLFDSVNTHEPKGAPGNGVICAIWIDYIGPVPSSGLNSTSGYVVFSVRSYTSMLAAPLDGIDPKLLGAVTTLLNEYTGDFEFNDPSTGAPSANVRNIDLHGIHGRKMDAQAGYINLDGKLQRVMTITLPVIVNDMWTQEA
jgi:hypothetical protein